jgi:protein-disulfide isomerase
VPTLEQVLEAFPKQVKLVFMQYPLSFHQNAHPAALASLAAQRQGKFWPMHDMIFQNQANLKNAQGEYRFSEFAKTLGLNVAKFEKDMKDPALEKIIADHMKIGADALVSGTPSLYLNGKRVGDRSFDGLKKMIEAELAAKGGASPSKSQ